MLKRLASATVVLCALTASAAQGYPSAVKPDSLGVNAQFLISGTPYFPFPADRQAVVNKMAAAGVQVVRLPILWSAFEPTGPNWLTGVHTTDFTTLDSIFTALTNAGIRVAPVIASTPPWAREIPYSPNSSMPPANDTQYGWFVGEIARNYGVGGSFWARYNGGQPPRPVHTYEIWNEPNLGGYFQHITGTCNSAYGGPAQQPGPQKYAGMYAAAHAEIDEFDEDATVMVGGLVAQTVSSDSSGNCSVEEFLLGLKAHLGALAPDALAIHTYQGETAGGVNVFLPTAHDVEYRIRNVRNTIDNVVGWDGLPLYFNENGWAVCIEGDTGPCASPLNAASPYVSELDRTTALAQVADEIPRSNCGIRQYMPHTWRTGEQDKSSAPGAKEAWMGLAEADGDLHPSGQAWSDAIQRLQGNAQLAPPTRYLNICPWRGKPDLDGDGDLEDPVTDNPAFPPPTP